MFYLDKYLFSLCKSQSLSFKSVGNGGSGVKLSQGLNKELLLRLLFTKQAPIEKRAFSQILTQFKQEDTTYNFSEYFMVIM